MDGSGLMHKGLLRPHPGLAPSLLESIRTLIGGGYRFVPADKDGDGDYDPLISTSWDGDAYAAGAGTINWNTAFGVPANAKAVVLMVLIKDESPEGGIDLRGKSTSILPALDVMMAVASKYSERQGIVPIAADGTSHYTITHELDQVIIRVVGWYV